MDIPAAILGPYGALALAFLLVVAAARAIQILWKAHLADDARTAKRADDAEARNDKLIAILQRARRPKGDAK